MQAPKFAYTKKFKSQPSAGKAAGSIFWKSVRVIYVDRRAVWHYSDCQILLLFIKETSPRIHSQEDDMFTVKRVTLQHDTM
jgi:hypothetical protein